jgi:hypothetical protein
LILFLVEEEQRKQAEASKNTLITSSSVPMNIDNDNDTHDIGNAAEQEQQQQQQQLVVTTQSSKSKLISSSSSGSKLYRAKSFNR